MNAKSLAQALGGSLVGDGYMARCPAHNDSTPSLSIRDGENGRILFYCHAGCPQKSVLKALEARGLWTNGGLHLSSPLTPHAHTKRKSNRDEAIRRGAALNIWESALPAKGTLVESYLGSRGLHLQIPPTLRFHHGLKHVSGDIWPAMVALVTHGRDGTPQGVHRTYLAPNGAGKAPVDQQKMMRGPCRGGVVRLANPTHLLMIGEGIETCLSAMQATEWPAWAALSASGLRTLDLPDGVGDLIILMDADKAGEAAACHAAKRWKRQGRRVRVANPPEGSDFNDILLGCDAPDPNGGTK